jgi:hypothetical protein
MVSQWPIFSSVMPNVKSGWLIAGDLLWPLLGQWDLGPCRTSKHQWFPRLLEINLCLAKWVMPPLLVDRNPHRLWLLLARWKTEPAGASLEQFNSWPIH